MSNEKDASLYMGSYEIAELDAHLEADALEKASFLEYRKTWRGRLILWLGWDVLPIYVPKAFTKRLDLYSEERYFDLNVFERLFVCLNDPGCCVIGSAISNIVTLVIVLNLIIGIMFTIPNYRNEVPESCTTPVCVNDPIKCPGMTICEPIESSVLTNIDGACVYIFSIEYGLRMLLVWFMKSYNVRLLEIVERNWDTEEAERALKDGDKKKQDPEYAFWYPPLAYALLAKNVIDILAVLPFYISLAGSGVSLSFIRVLRLLRVLRALKIRGGGVAQVMINSLSDSVEPLALLLASSGLVVLVYGSIIYNLEQGQYVWRCDWDTAFNGETGQCRGGYIRPTIDDAAIMVSPFHSSLSGMYWAVITMTTVGYGDLFPTTNEGRCMACMCAFTGLILIALPISILGNNFSIEYRKYKKALSDEHDYKLAQVQRMRELERHKAERRRLMFPKMSKSYKNMMNAKAAGQAVEEEELGKEKIMPYKASQIEEANNYFEELDFQFDDKDLPPILPAQSVNIRKLNASATDHAASSYEEAIIFENTVLAKASQDSHDKNEVIKLLHQTLAKLKMTVRENEKRGRALKQIHHGFDQMEAFMKVMHSLQEAQEISVGVLGHVNPPNGGQKF